MSERSVKCPECVFSFARLIDAGDFHAYVCWDCGWTKLTSDTRPGNRPADVCALCDTAIDLTNMADSHLYFGRDWVWGAGSMASHIPIHNRCADAVRRYLRTGTLRNDECSCPEPWLTLNEGVHMSDCQQRSVA